MKAAVFKAPGEPLAIDTVPDPAPEASEVLIRVQACGICGTDLHWSERRDESGGWRKLHTGSVMGHEFAGEIVAVGADVRGEWKEGERICALPFIGCGHCDWCRAGRPNRCKAVKMRGGADVPGAYAEYTRVGPGAALRLPESMDAAAGALIEPLAVGLAAVKRARLQPGDNVLVVGGGPVGLAVALWCRFFGVRHVVVSDLIAARAERAAEFGATGFINASTETVTEQFQSLTRGNPQVVFDCVGVPGSFQLSIDYAPVDARVVIVGVCMAADTFFPVKAIMKELDLIFAFVYSKADFEMSIDMVARERIPALGMITDRVGFGGFPAAFEALKRPTDQIKVMLEPD